MSFMSLALTACSDKDEFEALPPNGETATITGVQMSQTDKVGGYDILVEWDAHTDASNILLNASNGKASIKETLLGSATSFTINDVEPDDTWTVTLAAQKGNSTSATTTASLLVRKTAIGFLSIYATPEELVANGDDDEASAWLWLHETYPTAQFLCFGNIRQSSDIEPFRVLFWLRDLENTSEDAIWSVPAEVEAATPIIKEWYKNGGNMLLWSHATTYIGHLGRLDLNMMRENDHTIGTSKGSINSDVWRMAVALNPGGRFSKDHSSHPIYKGLDIETNDRTKLIAIKGPGWTEDHNCLFFNLPSQLTGMNNQDEECYTQLTKVYGIYPLGTWDSQIDWVSQMNIWEARQGNTEFKGTILCMGNGGCEFSMKNPDGTPDKSAHPKNNIFQDNVLTLAKNSLEYLKIAGDPSVVVDPAEQSTPAAMNEQYRPQIHFTPAKNWMNDPNGMVYVDGVYHLFYQYNPYANDWGNMSWGHATSTDLVHWKEQPVALTRDALGDVFSGSAVVDKDNTAGFGANAMVAIYTSATSVQQQSIAYSTDGVKSFKRYDGNPVIRNNDDNLRDPKVFWHEESSQWIMVLAKGWKRGVEIYGSPDLKTWKHLSTFVSDLTGRASLQWECPDLIRMKSEGDNKEKWVLLVSVNPGGPVLGSGIMYFVGNFDGTTFTADAHDYPLWLDYGMDNYAGVTWSNTGERKVMIGWMNNWQYAGNVPCSPWRSAMTLPRELRLRDYNGQPLLCCPVVSEIDNIADTWQTASQQNVPFEASDAYQLQLTVNLDKTTTVTLSNDKNESYSIDIYGDSRTLTAHRKSSTGKTNFNGAFSIPSISAPLNVSGNTVTLDIFVDRSSVEIVTKDGTMSMTNLVFPQSIYNRLSVTDECEAKVRSLRSIWK